MPTFEVFRKMDWSKLVHEYDLDGKRLLPWPDYPMPFGAGWCVVRPHTHSEPHTQIDQELFIALNGRGIVVIGERRFAFEMGDIVVIPKHTVHYVINETDDDFHFYVIWWDKAHASCYLAENDERTGVLDG